jgi:hypothetical protein
VFVDKEVWGGRGSKEIRSDNVYLRNNGGNFARRFSRDPISLTDQVVIDFRTNIGGFPLNVRNVNYSACIKGGVIVTKIKICRVCPVIFDKEGILFSIPLTKALINTHYRLGLSLTRFKSERVVLGKKRGILGPNVFKGVGKSSHILRGYEMGIAKITPMTTHNSRSKEVLDGDCNSVVGDDVECAR